MNLKEEIIEFCKELDLDTIGFIKMRKFEELRSNLENYKEKGFYNEFAEEDIEKRINPLVEYPWGKTIISIAFPYFHKGTYSDNGFSVYTRGHDYHYVVNKYLNKIIEFISLKGGKAEAFCDSNLLPERYIAYLAGVGFVGKNNMIITKKYGSYVFLGEIITDLEIETDERNYLELKEFNECGECTICLGKCPTKAIKENEKNSNICLSYITQRKNIEDKWFKALNGRIFGCDSCQMSCPYNKSIEYSKIEEFKPFEFMNSEDSDWIIELGNKEFKDTLKKTSCGWRGKNVLVRNAIIKKVTVKNESINIKKISSPYVQDYYNRLL